METKKCKKCSSVKNAEEFSPNTKLKCSLHSWCKTCVNDNQKFRRLKISGKNPPKEGLKICTKCGEEKSATLEFFHSLSQVKSGLNPVCKICANQRLTKYKLKQTPDQLLKRKEWHKQYSVKNKAKAAKYARDRKKIDPAFRAICNVRKWGLEFLTGKYKMSHTIGCTFEEFKFHIEHQFQEGMTWDNYGEWELDHIVPLALAYKQGEEAFLEASKYSNLQPLWKADHINKTRGDVKKIRSM